MTQREIAATRAGPGIGVQHLLREIPAVRFDDLHVAVAKSPDELEAAQGLVYRRYRWRGYEIDRPAEEPERAGAGAPSRREVTIVAAVDGGMIGTCTLGFDGPLGLRADDSYGDVIGKARDAGRHVGEITRLAIDSADSKAVLASLFNLAYVAGKAIDDVTDVFIEINPRHVLFYTRVLGFAVAADERICERVGAPSVLLHVEMDALAVRLEMLSQRALTQPQYAQAA